MLALASRTRVYPVLLPERLPLRRPAPYGARRRARRSPAVRALAVAAIVVLPAIVYVWGETQAARSGYAILSLRQEVGALQTDNARLLATVTALKSPDRIDRIATGELGMVPPKHQQLAALTLPPAVLATHDVPGPSVWNALARWLGISEAEARESSR